MYINYSPLVVFFRKKFSHAESCAEESPAINHSSPLGEIRRLCRRFNNLFQASCGLRDHFATTVAHLWEIYGLSVAIEFQIFVFLYIYGGATYSAF